MAVSEILAGKGKEVVTASEQSTVQEVANLLSQHRIGAIIIVKDDRDVCGIVSERDIVREIAANGSKALTQPASKCMTQKVISCEPQDTVDILMQKMTTGRFRHLPVLERDNLVGIVSIGDVVKRKIEQAERDAEDMKRYIAG